MKTIIFDFDGTIADTFWLGFEIVNKLADEFGFKKVSKEEAEKYRQKSFSEVMRALGIPRFKLPFIAYRAKKELNKVIDKVKTIDGIIGTLQNLDNLGYEIGIVSSDSQENLDQFLERNDIKIFDFIQIGRKIFRKDKLLSKIVKKNKLKKNEVVYIGDEVRDIIAARRAGIKIIAVSWGYNAREALEKYKPDLIVDVPEELISAVQKV